MERRAIAKLRGRAGVVFDLLGQDAQRYRSAEPINLGFFSLPECQAAVWHLEGGLNERTLFNHIAVHAV